MNVRRRATIYFIWFELCGNRQKSMFTHIARGKWQRENMLVCMCVVRLMLFEHANYTLHRMILSNSIIYTVICMGECLCVVFDGYAYGYCEIE